MEDLVAVVVVLLIVGAVVYVAAQAASRTRTHGIQSAALESEAARVYYQQALQMARVLDRIQSDDMIAVTLPPTLKEQIRTMVEDFYGDDGRGPRQVPRA